jgi:hypothetical protein
MPNAGVKPQSIFSSLMTAVRSTMNIIRGDGCLLAMSLGPSYSVLSTSPFLSTTALAELEATPNGLTYRLGCVDNHLIQRMADTSDTNAI